MRPQNPFIMSHKNELKSTNQIAEIKVSYNPKLGSERTKITTSQDAQSVLISFWDKNVLEYKEEFVAIYLNRANHVLGIYKHSSGTEAACLVSVKQLLAIGLKCNASGFIVAHNHPSTNLRPSNQDIELTKKISEAAKVCELRLYDHIIIGSEESYYSFADEGLL